MSTIPSGTASDHSVDYGDNLTGFEGINWASAELDE